MNHSIKVTDEIYHELLTIQRPRETFSQMIGRLLKAASLLGKIAPIIEGHHEFLKLQVDQAQTDSKTEKG